MSIKMYWVYGLFTASIMLIKPICAADAMQKPKHLVLSIESIRLKNASSLDVTLTLVTFDRICLNGSRFMLSGLLRSIVFYDQDGRIWQIAPSSLVVQPPPLKADLSLRLDPSARTTVTLDSAFRLFKGEPPSVWPDTLNYIVVNSRYQVVLCDKLKTEWATVYGRGETKLLK